MSQPTIGPTLPQDWKATDDNHSHEDDDNVYGPALPPNLQSKSVDAKDDSNSVIGPSLPPHFQPSVQTHDESSGDPIGPVKPPLVTTSGTDHFDHCDSDSSDDVIGPLPESHQLYDKINQRYGDCSHVLAKSESQKQMRLEREEWMSMAPTRLAPVIPTKSVKHFSQRSVKSDDKTRDAKRYKKDHKREQELTELMDSYNKVIFVLVMDSNDSDLFFRAKSVISR